MFKLIGHQLTILYGLLVAMFMIMVYMMTQHVVSYRVIALIDILAIATIMSIWLPFFVNNDKEKSLLYTYASITILFFVYGYICNSDVISGALAIADVSAAFTTFWFWTEAKENEKLLSNRE
jgi:hypothetical protein